MCTHTFVVVLATNTIMVRIGRNVLLRVLSLSLVQGNIKVVAETTTAPKASERRLPLEVTAR